MFIAVFLVITGPIIIILVYTVAIFIFNHKGSSCTFFILAVVLIVSYVDFIVFKIATKKFVKVFDYKYGVLEERFA